jgi:hypothetical protein
MSRRIVEKDPKALLELGLQLKLAKAALSPAKYEEHLSLQRDLRHETREELVRDKANRLIALASMPVCWDYIDQLPETGWGTLRELSTDAADG